MPVHSNDHTTPNLSLDSAPPFSPEGNASTEENTPTRNPRKREGFWGLSWTGVAALCLMVMMQLVACGSTDANGEGDTPPEDPPTEEPPASLFAVSPSEISYGEVDTEAEAEAVFTITNSGDAALEGTIQVNEGSEHFQASDTGSYEVAAGSDLEVTVTFAPAEEAELSGALRITHNADNAASPSAVTLAGVGVVELADPPARP